MRALRYWTDCATGLRHWRWFERAGRPEYGRALIYPCSRAAAVAGALIGPPAAILSAAPRPAPYAPLPWIGQPDLYGAGVGGAGAYGLGAGYGFAPGGFGAAGLGLLAASNGSGRNGGADRLFYQQYHSPSPGRTLEQNGPVSVPPQTPLLPSHAGDVPHPVPEAPGVAVLAVGLAGVLGWRRWT